MLGNKNPPFVDAGFRRFWHSCSLVPYIMREQEEQEKQESFTPKEVPLVQPTPQGPVDHREQENSIDDVANNTDTDGVNDDPDLRL